MSVERPHFLMGFSHSAVEDLEVEVDMVGILLGKK